MDFRVCVGTGSEDEQNQRTKQNLTGAPCSRQLTWAEKDGRSPSIASNPSVLYLKFIEKVSLALYQGTTLVVP
jgi:hypothetical protein